MPARPISNNHAGATAATLYGIDAVTHQLVLIGTPNGGTITPIGALGVDTTGDVGFDITANDSVAFARCERAASHASTRST